MEYIAYAFFDALGFILVAGLLLGAPFLFLFVYGLYVAYKIGIRGQPTDLPEALKIPIRNEVRENSKDQAA